MMTKLMCGAAVIFMFCGSVLVGMPVQRDSVETGRLHPRIGAAEPEKYNAVRSYKDWKNPYLVIGQDGIEAIAQGVALGRKTVSATHLQQTLISLPLTAWPYGRVVVVQDTSIVAADRSDEQSIAKNRETTLSILKTLRVMAERWPG